MLKDSRARTGPPWQWVSRVSRSAMCRQQGWRSWLGTLCTASAWGRCFPGSWSTSIITHQRPHWPSQQHRHRRRHRPRLRSLCARRRHRRRHRPFHATSAASPRPLLEQSDPAPRSESSPASAPARVESTVWRLLADLGNAILGSGAPLGPLHASLVAPEHSPARQRCIFPLGLTDVIAVRTLVHLRYHDAVLFVIYANAVVVSLNWLSGVRPPVRMRRNRTTTQQAALHLCGYC